MKRIGLLIVVGLLISSHLGCGHRRTYSRTHQGTYNSAQSHSAQSHSAQSHSAQRESVGHHRDAPPLRTAPLPQPTVLPDNSVEAPLPPPAPQPVPPSIRIAETKAPTIDEAREPTPADPRTAPQGSYNVADIPGLLRPNQPSPPPQLY